MSTYRRVMYSHTLTCKRIKGTQLCLQLSMLVYAHRSLNILENLLSRLQRSCLPADKCSDPSSDIHSSEHIDHCSPFVQSWS
jgi:hypothetical protein